MHASWSQFSAPFAFVAIVEAFVTIVEAVVAVAGPYLTPPCPTLMLSENAVVGMAKSAAIATARM